MQAILIKKRVDQTYKKVICDDLLYNGDDKKQGTEEM